MDVRCRVKGWAHSQLKQISKTSSISYGSPMPLQRNKQSIINNFLNTSVISDGSPMPIQELDAFANQRIPE
jgi:hypothetical protein